MMKLIPGCSRTEHGHHIREMHRLRAKAFDERLGWEVEVRDGLEIDKFDALDPLYGLCIDELDRVVGTYRLLPTTGPTMLADVFSRCLPPGITISSPKIWESTRFCAFTKRHTGRGANGLANITGELLLSLMETGVSNGLSHIVTVTDIRMERILRRAAMPIQRLGEPVAYGEVPTVAILMEISSAHVARMRAVNSLSSSNRDVGR